MLPDTNTIELTIVCVCACVACRRMRSAWPAGGVKLRVRTRVRWGSNAVAVGGRAWAAVNATEQTILFAEAPEVGAAQDIVVLMPAAAGIDDGSL